jgi:3-oxoacyl-[acyl-carrier protein] reductase
VAAAFVAAAARGRPLVALVNCAGIHSQALVEELSNEEWHRILRVNLRGTFLCCRAAARAMPVQQVGAIVNMSSGLAYSGAHGRAHYAASKGAVSAFTRSLALELAPRGIRANAIAPGAMDTPMPRSIPGRTEEDVLATLRRNPLGRIGTADDVADLIVFLLSSRSAHITGQVIHINGGGLMP